jgi:Na+/H+ antiporter NhaD/arsenite permease-like protein
MDIQIVAGALFVATFVGILMERVDRTIIAMAGGAAMVAIGMAMGFYNQEEALASVDFNTLGLLLGMMILVALLAKTGFFQYLATLTAQKSGGSPWRLLLILGAITTVLSMVLDNVTTIVLIAPISILIAEILGVSPIPFLISGALLSNTGGVATLVGDPPNILIGSAAGLGFNDFLVRLAPIVAVAWVGAVLLIRYLFREDMAQKPRDPSALEHIDPAEAITDKASLTKILIVMALVVLGFFLHTALHFEPAFVALLGAAAALLWVQPEVEEMLREVEWSVLLFFAALFILVGGVEASGLLADMARSVTAMAEANLLLAGIVLIWGAAILSAIVDNIPFTWAPAGWTLPRCGGPWR